MRGWFGSLLKSQHMRTPLVFLKPQGYVATKSDERMGSWLSKMQGPCGFGVALWWVAGFAGTFLFGLLGAAESRQDPFNLAQQRR